MKADEAEGVLSSTVQENLTGVRVVRAFGREKYEIDRFDERNEHFAGLWIRLGKIMSAYWATGDFITCLQILTVLIAGTVLTVHQQLTLGEFLAFVSYNSTLAWPIRSLGRILSDMSKAGVSVERVAYILDAEEEKEEEEDPREELVRRLTEYKMYKYAAEELKDLSVDAQKVFFKPETVPEEIKYYEEPIRPAEIVGDITLEKLNQIFRMVMRRKKDREDPVRSHFGKIQKEKYKVEDRMDDIRRQIRGLKKINFRTLLDIQPVKEMVIVTFLAVLELMKVGEIKVSQEHNFAEIYLDSCE